MINAGRHFERFGLYQLLLMAAAAMLIFGSLAGWVNKGPAVIPGIAGDGIITIVCGILILGFVLLLTVGERNRLFGVSLATYAVGFIALLVAVYYLIGVARCSAGISSSTAGIGLYVTLAGGAAAIIGSLGGIACVSRGNVSHPGELGSRERILMLSLTMAVAVMVLMVYLSIGK